jgi:ligand-binding sensor domain-containing protein
MKIHICILSLFTLIFTAYPQQVSDWKILTSMKTVNDIAVTTEGVWAATSGGVFFNSFQDDSYQTFTRAEGLSGISFTAVGTDKYGKIWIGSASGTIDVYNPADGSMRTILDIYNSDMTSKTINEITSSGDSVIISTNYGLSLINVNSYTILDTYFKFGSLTSNLKVNSALKSTLIYACTDSGAAIQKAGATNLSAPESWTSYSLNDGLPSYIVHKMIFYGDQLLAATGKGISAFNGTSWQTFISELTDEVLDLVYDGSSLFILTKNKVYSYTQGILNTVYESPYELGKLKSSQSDLYAAGNAGIVRISGGSSGILLPNGPAANLFFGTDVDPEGTFWAATGKDGAGVGFFKYKDGLWTNYNSSNTPQMPTNDYFSVYCAGDNTTYIGAWGRGFVRIKDDIISIFTNGNTGMQGEPNDASFVVVSGFAKDSKGNLWVLNYYPGDRKPLSMLSTDSTWYHFTTSAETQSYYQHYNLIIDQYDTKWYFINDPNKAGLFFFNENNTYQTTSDDRAGYLSTTNGLNSNNVTSIVIDRRGEIWVGTPAGVNVISNTGTIPSSSSPALRISTVYALRQQSVNCIAVDPLNQKWVGTNQGLLLVNSDGSSLLASFTTANSPLMTDIIKTVTIDEASGIVYAGTDMGIIKFQTFGLMPQDSFTELFIYPSPFVLKSSDNLLTIDGLIRDTDIKILNASGKLVYEFSSPGGYRATWNGTDLDGKLVSSGIYFVIAYDKEGNNVTTGKVAILR